MYTLRFFMSREKHPDLMVLTHLSIEIRYSQLDSLLQSDLVEFCLVTLARVVDIPKLTARHVPRGHEKR